MAEQIVSRFAHIVNDVTLPERWATFVVLVLALFTVFRGAFAVLDLFLGVRASRWLTKKGINAVDLYEDPAIAREAEAARILAARAAQDEACRAVVQQDLVNRRAAIRLVSAQRIH